MMLQDVRILLIDDIQTQFYLVEGLLLQAIGSRFTLDWVTTPQASLEMLNEHDYDVILLDYDLGQYTAVDFLKLFAEHDFTIPVIVLTSHNRMDVDLAVMHAGATDFISKTQLNAEILERTVRYTLERARYMNAIRESEVRFRAMVEKGSDLILELDGNGTIVYISPSCWHLLGYPEDEMTRTLLTDYIHPDDLPQFASLLETLIRQTNSPAGQNFQLHNASGNYVWFEFNATNHLKTDGVNALIISGRDVTEQRKRLQVEQSQRKTAEALLDTSIALNSTLDFDDVIERMLENIGSIIPHQSANVMLIDENNRTYTKATKGYHTYDYELDPMQFVIQVDEMPTMSQIVATKSPLLIHDTDTHPLWKKIDQEMQYRSYLGAPILEDDIVIGFINLESLHPHQFNDNHVEYLQLFAFLASLAISNARAYDEAQQLAIVEERQRLARELHDAVSQTLFSSSVIADSLSKSNFDDVEHIREGLERLTQLNRGALAEMRALLVELRPKAITDSPLSELIKSLTDSLQGRGNVQIELKLSDAPIIFPPKVQLNLYRLAQEIFNNIYKHAQAETVHIDMRQQIDQVEIVIADDGIGFDLNNIPANHHGIRIMHERVQAIGASLDIDTTPNEGTFIHIHWKANPQGAIR
ncbi:MAG: PAS domain S-box protein [Chloroflexota bacterium]